MFAGVLRTRDEAAEVSRGGPLYGARGLARVHEASATRMRKFSVTTPAYLTRLPPISRRPPKRLSNASRSSAGCEAAGRPFRLPSGRAKRSRQTEGAIDDVLFWRRS